MQQNQLWWCRTHYSKRASEHALREPPLRRTRRILNYLAVYLHAVPRPPSAISLFLQGIWVMCCAINIRIADTKYFCILFLAKHLKLKITITFNLAQRTNILHCVSRECWFVYHSLPSNITICLAHILSLAPFLSLVLYAKVEAKTKKVAAALLYLPLATWRRSRQQNLANLAAATWRSAQNTGLPFAIMARP